MKKFSRRTKHAFIALGICVGILAVGALLVKVSLERGGEAATDILTPPAAGASDTEKRAYSALVVGTAKMADALVLGPGCAPEPLVMSVALKGTFTVKNADTVEHVLVFDKEHRYPVPPGSTKSVVADFGPEAGIYGYGCDASKKAVGMLLITAE